MPNGCDMILHDLEEAMQAARRLESEGKRGLARQAWARARRLCREAAAQHDKGTKVRRYLFWLMARMGRP